MYKKYSVSVALVAAMMPLWAMVLFLYWPAIQGGLAWDDEALVRMHDLLNHKNWFQNCFQRYFMLTEYYRPLPLLSLIANGLWGAEYFPIASHVTNLLLFCINLSLVMLLVWKIASRPWIAAVVAGVFYAIHPALLESVAWISGRCDLLMTLFILLALYLDLQLQQWFKLKVLLVSLCFFCAALSKEMAVVFPAILMLWRFYVQDMPVPGWREISAWFRRDKNWLYLFCVVFAGVFYLLLRVYLMGTVYRGVTGLMARDIGNAYFHTLLMLKTFAWYWLLQLFPHYDLSAVYPTTYPVTFDDGFVWMGAVILALFVLLLLNRKVENKIKYGLLISGLLFLPVSNLRPLLAWDSFIHLRFLTLPVSFLLICFVPLLVDRLTEVRKQLLSIFLLVGLLWCFSSAINIKVTVPLWSNDYSLWKWVAETKPDSYLALTNYSAALAARGDYRGCVEAGEAAIQYHPKASKPYVGVAYCYLALGENDRAFIYADRALDTPIQRQADTYSLLLALFARMEMDKIASVAEKNLVADVESINVISELLQTALIVDENNVNAEILLMAWSIYLQQNDTARGFAQKLYKRKIPAEEIMAVIKRQKVFNAKHQETSRQMLAGVYGQNAREQP